MVNKESSPSDLHLYSDIPHVLPW